jgi:ATP-dependent DNA helicase PIF1
MFKQAVQDHNTIASTSPPNVAYKQASLGNTFNRTGHVQPPATRPLANGTKHNTAAPQRPSGATIQGTKRTSNGLAKSLSSQEDVEYPTLNIAGMGKENELPPAFHTSSRSNSGSLASALFDEDDFDSDIDLDVEDPATKGTVTYPTLPRVAAGNSSDSGYNSRTQSVQPKLELLNSSQPIPWSSSPPEHFKTPQKPEPPKSKRRKLPWSVQEAQSTQGNDIIEEDIVPAKKGRSTEVEKTVSTPAPKQSKTEQYLFNTTASALKQQQKAFRENMKAQAKTQQGTDEDVKEAIRKKKKNTVHRIFLSEEQQNVLNLVAEYKKSVFFTGSAGKTH